MRPWTGTPACRLPPLLAVGILGSTSGLPLILAGGALQAWMKSENVDLAWIGLFALTGLPYSLKFLWAPLLDRFRPPFGGRRRGWILLMAVAIMACTLLMARCHPAAHLGRLAGLAFLMAFCSASADINIDVLRVEMLPNRLAGLGATLYFTCLRVTMLVVSALVLWLSDRMPWQTVYQILIVALVPGALTALLAPEPATAAPPGSLREAISGPFREFFGRRHALELLAFVLLFKLGDGLASTLNIPFLMELGFTRTEIARATQGIGLGTLAAGAVLGGWFVHRASLHRVLWVLGAAQVAGVLLTAVLARGGRTVLLLDAVIALENSIFAMGTVALLALLQRLCDPRHAATQFAFLVSLNALARVFFAAPAGLLAHRLGWPGYFVLCAFLSLAGLVLLLRYASWGLDQERPQPEAIQMPP